MVAHYVTHELLAAVSFKFAVFWRVTPYNLVHGPYSLITDYEKHSTPYQTNPYQNAR
jgi:hypothetical protein